MIYLLPCPFCGKEPEEHSSGSVVKCITPLCPASMGWASLDAWNDRYSIEADTEITDSEGRLL